MFSESWRTTQGESTGSRHPVPRVRRDIDGAVWPDETKPLSAKGPTGACVRTLTDLAVG